ncbi:hypothetical protein V8E53_003884 [Lactarius tabidus]
MMHYITCLHCHGRGHSAALASRFSSDLAHFPVPPMNVICLAHAGHHHTLGEGPSANYCSPSHYALDYLNQQLPITGTEGLVYACPNACPTPSSPVENSVVATPTKDWYCHFCLVPFHRWQDRGRHEQAHLPHFLHCPLPHCEWRGNRTHTFKTHWQKKDHRPFHKFYGHFPERSQIETYDPQPILNQFRNGEISFSEAADQAIFVVQVMAYELQKPSMWRHPWGRGRKQASRCRRSGK